MEIFPKLLDLYCGAGGAAMGYYQAGFEVVGVDRKHQPRYPFTFVQADALLFLLAHWYEFDALHASPPCQHYTNLNCVYRDRHPDNIPPVQIALRRTELPYVIENVPGARHLLRRPVCLTGGMFGLPTVRRRYFEIGRGDEVMEIETPPEQRVHRPVLISGTTRRKGEPRRESSVQERRDAIQCPWMTGTELDEAIPPAYARFIGEAILHRFLS